MALVQALRWFKAGGQGALNPHVIPLIIPQGPLDLTFHLAKTPSLPQLA